MSALHRHLIILMALLAGGGALSHAAPNGTGAAVPARSARGDFGFPLDFLRQHYSGPAGPEESNHFIDLWTEQKMRGIALESGLTNNHALFINSHGMEMQTARGTQFAFHPHEKLLKRNEKVPHYSAADLARVLGPANADRIHNILVSACDAEASFSARELRKHFVNATNIVHIPPCKFGYQAMFFQVLTTHSSNIKPLYETSVKNRAGKLEYFTNNTPSPNATEFSPYIAELFIPGRLSPYRIQTAGRELLVPGQRPCVSEPQAPL